MANSNNAFAVSAHRQLVFETLFAYDLLTNTLKPQLGTQFRWRGQTLTVTLNSNAKWNDGTAVTAADVVYSFELGKTYAIGARQWWDFIESVTASGNNTVVIQAKADNFNPKQVERAISEHWITPRAYWEAEIAAGRLGRREGDMSGFQAWTLYGSGPYSMYFHDATKVVLIRNDNYWGQHRSLRGKLPAPKYIAHNIYSDNAAGDLAFRRGEVDVSQQFVAQIWTYFNQGISTYLPQAPYYLPGYIPTIFFNVRRPGLDDPAVRKAIAMVINYEQIGTNAMSGYTAPKESHMMLPAERSLLNLNDLRPHQWTGIDVAGANKLLDDAGWVRGADGIRAKGGTRLVFRIQCPSGWTDWNASLEIVASSARQIGIQINTHFTEQPVWTSDMQSGNFDIIMNNTAAPGAASPWSRAYNLMHTDFLPTSPGTPNTIGNWGRWQNAEANQILDQLATETNASRIRQLWTRLNIIYLQEMPFVGLMYRPWQFHQVYEGVWTNFPKPGDGVPPTILLDGYGIQGLFNIRLK